jgi:hypothetical protein
LDFGVEALGHGVGDGEKREVEQPLQMLGQHLGDLYHFRQAGGNYNSFGSYSATSTTYNPASMVSALAAVNANTLQQMNVISANRNASLADLDSMLRTTTIPPGAAYGGNIVFKLPPAPGKIPKGILVTVRTPLDGHQIKVALRKR